MLKVREILVSFVVEIEIFLSSKVSILTFWSGRSMKLTTYVHLAENYLFVVPQPYSGPGRLIVGVSISHAISGTTVGRTPQDDVSSLRRDLYLTTPDIHKRQASVSLTGFESAIPSSERPQTHASDPTATQLYTSPPPRIYLHGINRDNFT